MGHLVVLLHIPFLIPTFKWAECPPPSCSTAMLLPKHQDSWGLRRQGPTSPSDETPVYMGCPAARPSPADHHPPGRQCWWHNATSKAEWETNEAEGKRM